ncbi:MAG TPA: type II toxin-antitoxin system HicB family antitoxin [Dongiaceae bacterium]|nr:type II toxin-antitoxin system HicB family antitoxin [Dongiaceae bacterium]
MRYYVALIHKDRGSAFGVSFPDFPGCVTVGETIEEAIERAADILAAHVAGMQEDGDPIPEPRSVEHIRKARDEWVDFTDATVAMIPLLDRTGKPKAVNVSLDTGLLQSVDRYAEAIGSTRSAVLTGGGTLLMRMRPASKVNPARLSEMNVSASGSPLHRTLREAATGRYVTAKGGRTMVKNVLSQRPSDKKK